MFICTPLTAVTWLKYCRSGVKRYLINQSNNHPSYVQWCVLIAYHALGACIILHAHVHERTLAICTPGHIVKFLTCHTCYDTGHPFMMVTSEDPWHSHLSGAATTCFNDLGLLQLGFKQPTSVCGARNILFTGSK